MLLIENAELNWQGSVPVNKMFDDPYFSLESGEAESKYVFLRHNNLPEAFLNKHSFAIGETGFGTGLNFFVTAQSWMAHRLSYPLSNGKVSNGKVSNGKVSNGKVPNGKVPNGKAAKLIDSHLYYYSVEKYPISKTELLDIHKKWPQFYDLSTTLMSQYPGNCPGFHRLHFAEQNITLVLMVGDVCDMLGKLQSNMDAWFLDGFSPSKNPDMWSENVFNKIARLSNSGATFATFTAAGFVRRNLQSVGFTVNKSPGFGKKREMISGMLVNSTKGECTSPWYSLAKVKSNRSRYKQKAPVVIIGGGVAGLSCALSLAEKNIKSILIESGETFGVGASGNPAGIVLPRINANMDLVSQFYISCFETATYHYNELKNKFPELQWFQNGVLQFESDERLAKLGQLLLPSSLASVVDSKTASKIAGVDLDKSAVYYPQAGTINPFQLCEILAAAAGNNLQTLFSNTVHSLTKEDNTWVVKGCDGDEICSAENVIIANGSDASRLLGTSALTLQPSRGQISYLPVSEISGSLMVNLCGDGYMTPAQDGKHVIGATYGDTTVDLKEADHNENWTSANSLMPGDLSGKNSISIAEGRVSFRAITQDHLPIVGPVVDKVFFKEHYADLHHGKPEKNYQNAEYLNGLYLSVGHGSRGLISCMGSSGYIASLIAGSPIIEPADTMALLHSGRFLIRGYKKNREITTASG